MANRSPIAANGRSKPGSKETLISAGDHKGLGETDSLGEPINGEQVELAASYRSVHLSNGAWFLGLLRQALVAGGVTQSRIADETERDTTTINLMLGGRQAIAADVVTAVLANDRLGIVLAGLSKRLGYEPPRRRAEDLAEENRQLRAQLARLRAALEEA